MQASSSESECAPRKVCVALDRSPRSRDAFMWVMSNFIRPSDSLLLLCATPDAIEFSGSAFEGVPAIFADFEAEKRVSKIMLNKYQEYCELNHIECDTEHLSGRPEDVLVATAKKAQVDVMVVGNGAKTGSERFILGSTSEAVVHQANFPVVVIKTAHSTHLHSHGSRKIILAVDGTASSEAAFEWVADNIVQSTQRPEATGSTVDEEGKEGGKMGEETPTDDELFIVHIDSEHQSPSQPVPGERSVHGTASNLIRAYSAKCELRGLSYNAMDVRSHKPPAEALAGVVRALHADLLVTGCTGKGALKRAMFGSVSDAAIRTSPCDLVIVKQQGRSPASS